MLVHLAIMEVLVQTSEIRLNANVVWDLLAIGVKQEVKLFITSCKTSLS